MPSAGSSKRKAASSKPEPSTTAATKRARKNKAPAEIIVIEDSDEEDDELKILAQIKAQEASENLAKELQEEFAEAGDTPMEDDEALARRLAEEWAKEEDSMARYLAYRFRKEPTLEILMLQHAKERRKSAKFPIPSPTKL
ncbi:hypothetical protein HYPSUDRAFT_197335 [Hypholoma sublateritium FD-334 SS-4]|uniref:Uncharacterized protein n=1 Tax=Hypholoma sublateritium (strain FD-334 SS-4) TaxID=945553 RepID=A0A0D2MWR8_HYPSF|nr:hypothetical protein HYPSUDRAFT_197335 [Hypholoma sublateritium FD-334 SS-4]